MQWSLDVILDPSIKLIEVHRRLRPVFSTLKHLHGVLVAQLLDEVARLLDDDGEENQFEELELNGLVGQVKGEVLEATCLGRLSGGVEVSHQVRVRGE